MKTLVLGATGYAGRPTVAALQAAGHEVYGLARSPTAVTALAGMGVKPIEGDARRPDEWIGAIGHIDAMITMLSGIDFVEEQEVMRQLVAGFRGAGRSFVFTCGTAVLSIEANEGQWDENTFAEDDPFPFPALPIRSARMPTEGLVREAGTDGFRTMVVRPPMIYGHGGSNQVPGFFDSALAHGFVSYVGLGLNLYSNVHVEDLAALYPLALERGKPGALYHAVGGEENFRAVAEAAGCILGLPVRSVSLEEACTYRNPFAVRFGIAVNSRSRAPRSRAELGWKPAHPDMLGDIRNGSYRRAYGHRAATGGADA